MFCDWFAWTKECYFWVWLCHSSVNLGGGDPPQLYWCLCCSRINKLHEIEKKLTIMYTRVLCTRILKHIICVQMRYILFSQRLAFSRCGWFLCETCTDRTVYQSHKYNTGWYRFYMGKTCLLWNFLATALIELLSLSLLMIVPCLTWIDSDVSLLITSMVVVLYDMFCPFIPSVGIK